MQERAPTDSKFPPAAAKAAVPRAKSKIVTTTARPESSGSEEQQAARQQAPTAVQPIEPEDAYLTGVSRSLQRRLLGLNVNGPKGQSKPHPEATAAGLHATGSFTGTGGAGPKEKTRKRK